MLRVSAPESSDDFAAEFPRGEFRSKEAIFVRGRISLKRRRRRHRVQLKKTRPENCPPIENFHILHDIVHDDTSDNGSGLRPRPLLLEELEDESFDTFEPFDTFESFDTFELYAALWGLRRGEEDASCPSQGP